MSITASVKSRYEDAVNALLQAGFLGHGIQEDLLVSSADWFDAKLIPDGGAFADFFHAALERHIELLCAVELDLNSDVERADFHDFLTVVLRWLAAFPLSILEKSPTPLKLVVGSMGFGSNLGAQVMIQGGPSLIYWGMFKSIRSSIGSLGYADLSEQIRLALAHELIGHQLAFCTPNGPLVCREDLREIFELCGIRFLKLVDSPCLDVNDFLSSPDLLKATQRIQYFSSLRDAHRYYSNITELIAFAIHGEAATPKLPYDKILSILKQNLLREEQPLTDPADDGRALYQGYTFAEPQFSPYFIERIEGEWHETQAAISQNRWITLADVQLGFQRARSALDDCTLEYIKPKSDFHLNIANNAYMLALDHLSLLACPLGVFRKLDKGQERCPSSFSLQEARVEVRDMDEPGASLIKITNPSAAVLPFKLARIKLGLPKRV